MKRKIFTLVLGALFLLSGCTQAEPQADIVATTLPVYEFTVSLCQGTGLTVQQLVTENVSCLHDYSLSVSQVKALEAAQVVVTSGFGLEDFMEDILSGKTSIDASQGITPIESCHEEAHEGHHHAVDPHIWLSPVCAAEMAKNICAGLKAQFPSHSDRFEANLADLLSRLQALQAYGETALGTLEQRKLITFHDGFAYFAQSFGLEIIKAIEEESGSEASARELIELIGLVREHQLKAVFTEENGSVSAAQVIAAETGVQVYTLRMAMAGSSYFDAMYSNIDTLKEAFG